VRALAVSAGQQVVHGQLICTLDDG
jgi:hypothetical protein